MGRGADNLTFWEHLDELRNTLMRIIGVALFFGIAAFCCKEPLFDVILAPSNSDFVTYKLLNKVAALANAFPSNFSIDLINTALAQQFIIHMKAALYAGFFCALPYVIYALLRFISPALGISQKRYTYAIVGSGYVMFLVGVLLCYFLIFPLTFRFLGTYQVDSAVVNMIALDSYISTFMGMCLMLGIVCELPVLSWLLAKIGVLKSEFMRNYRKHAIVAILMVAAVITPTSDIFTLTLVSLPMWLLYEISIGVVAHTSKL